MLDFLAPIVGFALEFVIAIGIVGIIMIIEKIQNWNKPKKKYYKVSRSLCLPKSTNKSAIWPE